jgi:hypothetical protein
MTKKIEQAKELRFLKHRVTMSNQAIVEMAYITIAMVNMAMGHKLTLDEANNYTFCFYFCRKLLKMVDQRYLNTHKTLMKFYKDGRELSKDWDRLAWEGTEK